MRSLVMAARGRPTRLAIEHRAFSCTLKSAADSGNLNGVLIFQ